MRLLSFISLSRATKGTLKFWLAIMDAAELSNSATEYKKSKEVFQFSGEIIIPFKFFHGDFENTSL